MRRSTILTAHLLGLAALAAPPAWASFHFMNVVEVFAGAPASPSAQYVVLQMYSSGQNQVQNQTLRIYNATGGEVGTFTFPANPIPGVANSANQDKILIATAAAATFFSLSADLVMSTAVLNPAGGAACFINVDCVSWGSFSGSLPSAAGTPFPGGIAAASAIKRKLGANGTLDFPPADDTNDSATDFAAGTPAPRNNAQVNGTVPPTLCGNSVYNGLETCDDGGIVPGDGCSATCTVETGWACTGTGAGSCNTICGDTLIVGNEQCDDGNAANSDACLNSCLNATCGDTFVRTGVEQCEPPSTTACNAACLYILRFFTVAPCRVYDSRNPGNTGLPLGPVERLTTIGGSVCAEVPAAAKAASLNLTVTQATAAGTLSVYPETGLANPPGTIAFAVGQTRANNLVVGLSTVDLGKLVLKPNLAGTVHVIVDVNGFFDVVP